MDNIKVDSNIIKNQIIDYVKSLSEDERSHIQDDDWYNENQIDKQPKKDLFRIKFNIPVG